MNSNIKELYQFARNITYQAGQLILELKKQPLQLEEKKNFSDLVTIVDKTVESFLVDRILEKYPNHGILGEEGSFQKDLKECDTIWIIDPIDGTTNFIHDFPFYGISIGIMNKGEGIIGIVYNPATNELFHAMKGNGSFVNEKEVKITNPLKLQESLISTSMFWTDNKTKDSLHPSVINIYKDTRGIRMIGGAALSLTNISLGRINAYIMPQLSSWDMAGGKLFLEEAGGVVTNLEGENFPLNTNGSILASHPDIHLKLLSYFKAK